MQSAQRRTARRGDPHRDRGAGDPSGATEDTRLRTPAAAELRHERRPCAPWGARAFAAAAASIALIAGCAPSLAPPPTDGVAAPATAAQAPRDFPGAWYRQALARGERVYEIDPAASLVVVEVRRGGALARLGHDHVVASRDVHGFLAPGARRADLWVPLDTLTVDEPALRAEAAFDTTPTEAMIAGTRENMLGPVLNAAAHPYALLAITAAGRDEPASALDAAITLHGATRSLRISATLVERPDGLEASGRFPLLQSDFGIRPFSVLGGALRVDDRVDIRYHLRARILAP